MYYPFGVHFPRYHPFGAKVGRRGRFEIHLLPHAVKSVCEGIFYAHQDRPIVYARCVDRGRDEIPTPAVRYTTVGGKAVQRKTTLPLINSKGEQKMLRDPLLLCALLILGFALNKARPARAQVISLKEAIDLPKPPPDHRIPYGDDRNQFGDLRLPAGDGPFPVVIAIHGGCYQAKYDLTLLSSFCADLTSAGVATWDLEYRRVGNKGGGWPGTFEDIARGSDYLRVVAQNYPIDLTRVVAVGHSAGGHFVAWLAARSRLPKDSVLYSEDPISLLGVVPLAGVMDSRADLKGGVCEKITPRILGGLPSEVPDHYDQASAIELLPIGIPIRSIIGDQDGTVLIDMVKRYDEKARAAGDDSKLSIVEGAGHFELTTPGSIAWELVKETVLSLLEPK